MTPTCTPESVERGYNNRAAVPDHPQLARAVRRDARRPRSRRWRRSSICATAPIPKETLDLFLPAGHAARHARVHPRRLLARARQGRFSFVARAVRRARLRGRRRQLRPLSVGHDRDDRRRMPARASSGSRAKRPRARRLRRRWLSAVIPPAAIWSRCCSRPTGGAHGLAAPPFVARRHAVGRSRSRAAAVLSTMNADLRLDAARGARACRPALRRNDARTALRRGRRRRDVRIPAPVATHAATPGRTIALRA